jgi:hypothetical protein
MWDWWWAKEQSGNFLSESLVWETWPTFVGQFLSSATLTRDSLVHITINNKLLIYKTIPKPIWTYGIKLWGTTSTSNIEIFERFQSKALRIIKDAPWYVPNTMIQKGVHILTVENEISRLVAVCLVATTNTASASACTKNGLILNHQEPPETRRLRRHLPTDLLTRLNM